MWKTVDVRILLLFLLLLPKVKTTELLSDQKKCGDPECETSIIRVQAIEDYTGPDCRYLNFKSGEEIMVYFKLSRRREDLWAGSKGKDFGYFPRDTVRTEETFVTEEVEVPTKETDFLCLDGGEYVFENKDSILNIEDEENEYMPFYTDEEFSKSNFPQDEAQGVTGTSFPKEYKDPDSDDSKSKDHHTLETTRHEDSELRGGKIEADESIQPEDQESQNLKPDPKQATWSVSGIAGWLGLGGKQEEELVKEVSKTEEQITFRRRKISIIDDSDFNGLKLNDDSETESRTWFQSTLTDLMHFGSEKSGFSLLHKENYPDVQEVSRITGDADHHGSTAASDTQEEEPRDSTVPQSNWFDLDISDVLTFGYSNKNEVKREKYEGTETTSPNEESLPPSVHSAEILMDQSLRTSESPNHEVQEKYFQEITEVTKTNSKVKLANDLTDFKEATDISVSTEPGDKLLQSHYAEHSSVSDSEVMDNLNVKDIMKESGIKNDQSGWYGSIYSSIFGFSRVRSDNQPAHDSVSIQKSQELVIDQFLPSHGADQSFLPKHSSAAREENSGSPQTHQSFFSFSPFTNTLNAEGFASEGKENVQITEQALKSREVSSQTKKEGKGFHIKKESRAQLVGDKKVTENVSVVLDVATSQENILQSSLATKNHEDSREKLQDDELVKASTSRFQSVKFRLEQGICYSQHIQITTYGKPENLKIQDHCNKEDKNDTPILEDKQCSSLELENMDDLLTQLKYTGEVIHSHEKFVSVLEEPDDGIAARSKDKTEEVNNSHVPATETYLERLSKGEMTETTQYKEGSNQVPNRKLMFKELKEHTDHFPQVKDNPHEDEVLHDVSDDDKTDMHPSRQQLLPANFEKIENSDVKEIARHSDSRRSQKKCNVFFPNSIADVYENLFHNPKEAGAVVSQGTQNSAEFPSRSCESRDLIDASHSEKKTSKSEDLQHFLSFNGYEHLLSFQCSTEKDKDALQRSQKNISSSVENSQSKHSPKLRNKVAAKYNPAMKKVCLANKDTFLTSLAKQNKDSEGTNLLKFKPPVSSAEHPSGHIMESLYSNHKLEGKSTKESEAEQFPNKKPHLWEKQHEAPTLKFSIQKLSQDYKVANEEPTSGIQDVNEKEETQKNFISKALEREDHSFSIDYTNVMKKQQISDSVSPFKSRWEKHVNDNIQGAYVVDSCDENESPDLKSKGKVCLDYTKDYFPTNSDDNDNLIKSVVPNERINQFSQERIKEQGQLSQCVSELRESKQGDSMQDTEGELKKQTNKNHSNILNNQDPSSGATSKDVLKNEKDIPGTGSCMSKDDFINNSVQNTGIQVPHKWTAGKHVEEEHSSKLVQENFDHTEVSYASLTAKATDNHGLKEKLILSYPSSDTFSSKMPVRLPYLKEDQRDLKVQQEVLSSHSELSDCENSHIQSQRLAEKHICQMVHNKRKHFPQTPDLDVLELGVFTGHKQQNNILNIQSQTYHIGHNEDPRLESVDHPLDHVPLNTKHSLDMSHLTIDLNDENFPKTLNYIEQFADCGGSQEKSKKITGSEKEVAVKNIEGINDNTRREDMVGNIFTKTSWFLGKLFQNNHNEYSQINENSADNIVTQGQEAEILGSGSEQDKGEVQNTKAISYSTDNFKIMEQESREEIYKHTQEKSITIDSRDDSQKDNTFFIQETVSVVQETVKNYKLISDKELEQEKAGSFSGFQEHYINLAQEFKRILQATMCESYELLLLEEEFENLHQDITALPCEEVFSEGKQVITSAKYENTFMTEHKECLNRKMDLVAELQSLLLDVRNKCEAQQADSGITNAEKLYGSTNTVNSDKKAHSGQHLKTNKVPSVNIEHKMCTSESGSQLNLKKRVLTRNPMTQNSTFSYEREWVYQITLYLNDICDLIKSAFLFMMFMSEKVIAALPENVRPGPDLYGFPWEMVLCCAAVALLIVFLLMYRSYQSVRSRLYVGREKQLANKVAELVEDKCKLLEKLSLCEKEYEELENSLKDTSLLSESTSASHIKTACEQVRSSNSVLKQEIECLEKELEEEKSKQSQEDNLMAEIQGRMESLESEAKSVYQQIAEAKTTLKVYDINRERLKMSFQDAVEENSRLQESEKQLLQEAEGWGERFSELHEQIKMFESSKADMEESLKNKESQVKSLTECLLKMKDWSSAIGEHDDATDNYWDNDMKEETENGEHLDDEDKRTVRKLIYAAKLNASLKSLETERNQIYSELTDENKAKEELSERIENLQREHVTLQSEKTRFETEVQKLHQKLKVMTELYQENEMNLHRKLTVEEKERLQKEEKLSKADEKINHAAEELATYRQRAKDLEDELERTVRSYQNQIMSHEKKAHDNWLTARATERLLNDMKKENLHCRQQLTEAEIKCDLLEKDPYALHVPIRPFGREQSPYGPSPMGRPSSETRAFLSPPTLLEGPLRLSPVLPGGGGRGSRGPGNTGIYEAGNEREELSSDRLSNPHRPPSDSGSLSPPWDRNRRIMPLPAGQPYNDQSLPPQRQERFYPNLPNSGRLSGPAELRSYNMHSFDKADGHISENNSRMDLSGNGINDNPNDSNMPNAVDHPVAPEGETFGPGFVPPPLPLLRAPLMPMDPRGPFMRRGPPFPPVPPSGVYGPPREYFPRDFSSLPRPLLPMRTPFPLRPFSQYPLPRAGFFPPPPPPDNSNELPVGLTQPSTAASTDHPEQET